MDSKTVRQFSIFFAVVYFFSLNGIAALTNLSVTFLLKEKFNLSAAQTAYFQAVTLIAWVIKPLWGYISDAFPIAGKRRKPYLILTSILAGISWLALGVVPQFSVAWLLIWILIGTMAYAFQDVVTDGLMVEVGQPANLTGKFQSIQWSAVYLAMILTSFVGGYVADLAREGKLSYPFLFSVSSIFPFLTLTVIFFTVQEKRAPAISKSLSFRKAFENKTVWLLSLFLFLWMFSPSFGTPFMYYAVDKLKFNGTFLGWLQGIASLTAFLTSVFLAKWIDRLPIRKCLVLAVFLGAGLILFHLIYFQPWFVSHLEWVRWLTLVLRVPLAFFDTVIFLILINLAAKLCPQEAGGSSFALLMSFYNLGQLGGGVLGGWLFSTIGLAPLIVVSALFSFLALFVLPHLPIPEPLTRIEKIMLHTKKEN